ncbi:MAG TPA: MASE1 domain-containing protein [Caulobacteraceae bacterium]|nr:MASE1 domain-containing protein [Caulobacteraceae bacterium]
MASSPGSVAIEPPGAQRRPVASLAYAGELLVIALVYVAAAKLSLLFASINPSASPIWPPAGLALGLVLLRGYRIWPAVLVGAFVANALTQGNLATWSAIGVGNTLEAIVSAAAIKLWAGGRRAIETPVGIAKFAGAVALAGTPISASIGVAALAATGFAAWSNVGAIWTTWWLGDLAGAVVVAPVLLVWAPAVGSPRTLPAALAALAPVAALAVAVGLLAYSPLLRGFHARGAIAFLALLPLMWAALRGSPRETATTAMLLSGFAVWGALARAGPFQQPTLNDSFLLLIAFMVSASLPSLALSTALEARRQALEVSEADLAQTREQLFRSQKLEALGRLAGGVAHDFNNALAIVVGNLDLLLRGMPADDGRPRRYAVNALDGARRAVALSHSLLAFSREQRHELRPTDVNARIRELVRLLGGALGEATTIRTALAPDLWPALVDPIRLDSALVNLAVNARDAMPAGGELIIETTNVAPAAPADPGFVLICVRDTGIGMAEDVLEKALEPFFTTKGPGQGTGLGLSQVHDFIERAGGRIELDSQVGAGSVVRLYAPRALVAAPASPDLSEALTEATAAPSAASVLVVEDDPAVREFACAALDAIGYRPLAADGAEAALDLIDRNPDIGLVLTDVVMPGGDGRTLAKAAQRSRPDLPVVFMTGYAPDGLEPGALVLAKPFTAAQLAAKLSEALA